MISKVAHQTAGRNPAATWKAATAHNIYTYYKRVPQNFQFVPQAAHPVRPSTTLTTTTHQQPVGARMPTQTAYLSEQLYQYVLETKGEDQSTSARIAELVEKGKQMEEHNE